MDNLIKQTILKPAGMGPYFHVVVWRRKDNDVLESDLQTSVFCTWDDAAEFSDRIQANGHTLITIDLGVDWTDRQMSTGEVYHPLHSLKTPVDAVGQI